MTYASGPDARGKVKKIPNNGKNTYAQRDQSFEEAPGTAKTPVGPGCGADCKSELSCDTAAVKVFNGRRPLGYKEGRKAG